MAELTGALTAYRARANNRAVGHQQVAGVLGGLGMASSAAGVVNMVTGNAGVAALSFIGATALYGRAAQRLHKASLWKAKGRAIESLVMRSRDAKLAPGRAALQRAAAVRAVAEMRSTSLASRVARIRSGAKASGNGLVTSYTRVQGGRAIRVQGYSRR